jgi:hypothetical protein
VGAAVAAVLVVRWIGWYCYLDATITYPDQHPEIFYEIISCC